MHVHVEERGVRRSDCSIDTLSWMGKVPDTLPDGEGWKLNRATYYQEGWLATGNNAGLVGITFTAHHCKKTYDAPPRTNFNLRGHRTQVSLVRWNEPYQKLATCDTAGVIYVWIKHEGRWSIELINDRNSQVIDFAWSHDGRMALIVYRDGFVLVGSVSGQRFWSSMLNVQTCVVTSGVWSTDDQQVLLGTTNGQIIRMSSTGLMLSKTSLSEPQDICAMLPSCEKFNLSEDSADTADVTNNTGDVTATSATGDAIAVDNNTSGSKNGHTLAVSCKSGDIYLIEGDDPAAANVIHTHLTGLQMDWSNDGKILAVGGFRRKPNLECRNEVRFYSRQGVLRARLELDKTGKPLTSLTWGHNDRRVFVALGCYVYTIWVTKKVAPLQLLCHRRIERSLAQESHVKKLPLPNKLRGSISALFCPTIKGYIPQPSRLCEFVCVPPPPTERVYCTLMKHGDDLFGGYILYLEYLGGLIPLLRAKRTSKLKPEFVVYDPKILRRRKKLAQISAVISLDEEETVLLGSSDTDSCHSDGPSTVSMNAASCSPARSRRKKQLRKTRLARERRGEVAAEDVLYCKELSEDRKLLSVASNIWGTKFRIQGLASYLPEDLGSVIYKTSLLHLQPRQMTVNMAQLNKAHRRRSTCKPARPCAMEECSVDKTSPMRTLEARGSDTSSAHKRSPSRLKSNSLSPADHLAYPKKVTSHVDSVPVPSLQQLSPAMPKQNLLKAKSVPCRVAESMCVSCSAIPAQNAFPSTCDTHGRDCHKETFSSNQSIPSRVPTTYSFSENTSIPATSNVVSQATSILSTNSIQTTQTCSNESNSLPNNAFENCQLKQSSHCTSYISVPREINEETNNCSSNAAGVPVKYSTACVPVDCDTCPLSPTQIHASESSMRSPPQVTRWAQRPSKDSLKFIDEEGDDGGSLAIVKDMILSPIDELATKDCRVQQRSFSIPSNKAYATDLSMSQLESHCALTSALSLPETDASKRVVLSRVPATPCRGEYNGRDTPVHRYSVLARGSGIDVLMDKNSMGSNASLDSMDSASSCFSINSREPSQGCFSSPVCSPKFSKKFPFMRRGSDKKRARASSATRAEERVAKRQELCPPTQSQSVSMPSSPVHRTTARKKDRAKSRSDCEASPFGSPMFRSSALKTKKHGAVIDSSDEEGAGSGDEMGGTMTSQQYHNLATFQKAQLNKKMRRARGKVKRNSTESHELLLSPATTPTRTLRHPPRRPYVETGGEQIVMHNKAPLWNENSQVYQLDFGGRVTQESAKNFQIEHCGDQVLQFGRIDSHAYTLDFQYPFSCVQAFAVALANVTQRLK